MQRNDITPRRLRRLAEMRVDHGKVLSAYLGLPPSEFGTQPARSSAIRSLLDQAAGAVRSAGADKDEQAALEDDLARLEQFFEDAFSADGSHGVAVFASAPAKLFEVVRLPDAVETQVVVAEAPHVEPLTRMGARRHWAVLLVSRGKGRILRGSQTELSEARILDDDVHGQHSAGGWSQAGYQRSVDEEARRHVGAHLGLRRGALARR